MNLVKSVIIFLSALHLVSCSYQFQKKLKGKLRHKHKQNRISNRSSDEIIVKIDSGLVKGKKITNALYAFQGIPFASPPVDNLRFELPKKPANWNGTWNATYDRSQCTTSSNSLNVEGKEDCLYINVYIPQYPIGDVQLPVMVWVYGGSFLEGNSSYALYGPDFLIQKNIIFVSFNYRLGIFGFLSTGDKAAPGNIGLQDQIFALKWVQRNIKAFGGDAANVTLAGESAGSASVSYLVLSNQAKGLFKSAIMESGTALTAWSLSRTARRAAFLIGNKLGIYTTNSSKLVREMKKVPANNLQRMSALVMDVILLEDPFNGLVYAPVIEPEHKDAVHTNNSYELFANGNFNQVPSIIGFNSAEATYFIDPLTLLQFYFVPYDLFPYRLVPIDMNANKYELSTIGQKIKTHYAGPHGRLVYPDDNFTLYVSDNAFVRPILKTMELMSKYSPTYLYKFSYTTNPNSTGAPHAAEIKYIFKRNLTTPAQVQIRDCMVELFTNFIKYNDPTPSSNICSGNVSWKPVTHNTENSTYYLSINEHTVLSENPNERDRVFWNDLYEKYGHPPYTTY